MQSAVHTRWSTVYRHEVIFSCGIPGQHHGSCAVVTYGVLTSQDDLRRHPGPCAGGCHLAQVIVTHQCGEAHVRDLGRTIRVNQHVAGLQVQVDNPV